MEDFFIYKGIIKNSIKYLLVINNRFYKINQIKGEGKCINI